MTNTPPAVVAGRAPGGLPVTGDHADLLRAASDLVAREVGADLAVWATVDPATLLWTSCLPRGAARDAELERAVFANEYGGRDVLSLPGLLAGPRIGTLTAVTGGVPETSTRYRELLAPRGLTDELRVVLDDGTTAWGALCMYRAGAAFAPAEVSRIAALRRPLGVALRDSLVPRNPVGPPALDDAPACGSSAGLVLCAPDGTVREVNADARSLLAVGAGEPPAGVPALAVRAAAGGPGEALVPVGRGRWMLCQATLMSGGVAVVVRPPGPRERAGLLARAHGLTARERQVLPLLVRGLTNRAIARELGISEWTAQDHVKALLGKFGVSARGELVAALVG